MGHGRAGPEGNLRRAWRHQGARQPGAGRKADAPRAQLAFDASEFTPVPVKGRTVVGNDPYGAVTAVLSAEPVDPNAPRNYVRPAVPAPTPDNKEPEVRAAEKVLPMDHPVEGGKIPLEAPPALEF